MTTPSRMTSYTIHNDGVGPYAIFKCEKCHREFHSQPASSEGSALKELGEQAVGGLLRNIPLVGQSVASSATNAVDNLADNLTHAGTEMLGNLLHNVPGVGDAMAQNVAAADPHHALTLTPAQLNAAWQEVQRHFHECPTCRHIFCAADFDEASGFCNDHRPQGHTSKPHTTAGANHGTIEAARHGVARSPEWPRVEKEHLQLQPHCAACAPGAYAGSKVQVHHIFPFHYCVALGRPDLELDQRNLITLCENEEGHAAENHHLLLGHLDDFQSSNLDVAADVETTFRGMSAAAIKGDPRWKQKEAHRLKPLDEMTPQDKANFKAQMNARLPKK